MRLVYLYIYIRANRLHLRERVCIVKEDVVEQFVEVRIPWTAIRAIPAIASEDLVEPFANRYIHRVEAHVYHDPIARLGEINHKGTSQTQSSPTLDEAART